MSYNDAVKASRVWLLEIGTSIGRNAHAYSVVVDRLVDKLVLLAAIGDLPDALVLRLRCQHKVWEFNA